MACTGFCQEIVNLTPPFWKINYAIIVKYREKLTWIQTKISNHYFFSTNIVNKSHITFAVNNNPTKQNVGFYICLLHDSNYRVAALLPRKWNRII